MLDDTITRAKDLTDKGRRILKGDLTDIKQYFGEIKTAYSNSNQIPLGYMQDTNGGMHPVQRMDFDSGGKGVGSSVPKKTKPNQIHHYATDKSKTHTSAMKKITDKYGLDLDGSWNKDLLPHQG